MIEERQTIVHEDAQSAAATMLTAVTIYRVANLEPLIYFNIISSEDQWKPFLQGAQVSEDQFEKSLSARIVQRLKGDISAERKKTGVILPDAGDQEAKRLILNDHGAAAIERLKPLLPDQEVLELPLNQVREWYETQAAEAEKAGKGTVKRDLEQDLANFYLYTMAHETMEVKPATLQIAFQRYSWILATTESDALSSACAHSLGRLELFASRINPTTLQGVAFGGSSTPTTEQEAKETISEAPPAPEPVKPPEPQEKMIGEVAKGQTVGIVLNRHTKSAARTSQIIKKFNQSNPDQDLRRVRAGTKVFLSEDDQMRLDPPPMKRK